MIGAAAADYRNGATRALARPDLWPPALLAFLLRGGFVLFLAPIVTAPTPVALANLVGPSAVTAAGLSEGGIRVVATVGLALAAWVLVGGSIAAAAEAMLLRETVRDGGDPWPALQPPGGPPIAPVGPSVGLVVRLVIARLVALMPLAVALAWGSGRIVDAGYRELVLPSDLVTPLVVRVLRGAPEAAAVIVACWILGETIGGLAIRRIALDRRSVPGSLLDALAQLFRRTLGVTVTALIGLFGMAVVVGPAIFAAGVAWDLLRLALVGGSHPLVIVLCLGLFVAVWAGGLVLAGLVAAWRSYLWTIEHGEAHRPGAPGRALGGTAADPGTFGGSDVAL